jgi:hypothetical protein
MKLLSFCALVLILVGPVAAQERTGSAESKVIALEKARNQAHKFRDK